MATIPEIEKTQVYDSIGIECSEIFDNIEIVARSYTLIEINFQSILAKIRHFFIICEFYRIKVVSDELMGDSTFIDVFIDQSVVCLTAGVNDSFGFCCNIAEVYYKVQVLSYIVGERIVIQCNLLQIRAPPLTPRIQRYQLLFYSIIIYIFKDWAAFDCFIKNFPR